MADLRRGDAEARHRRARSAGERQGARPRAGPGGPLGGRAGDPRTSLREGAGAPEGRRAPCDRRAGQTREHRRLTVDIPTMVRVYSPRMRVGELAERAGVEGEAPRHY